MMRVKVKVAVGRRGLRRGRAKAKVTCSNQGLGSDLIIPVGMPPSTNVCKV